MKGARACSGAPEGSPDYMDLSLTGLPLPMSRRPNSASATKPLARSISVTAGSSEPRRKVLEATGPGSSRAINNLRRSNSATQVSQPWTGPPRSAETPDFLALFESSAVGRKRPASLGLAPSRQGATWHVLDDEPPELTLAPGACSPTAPTPPAGLRKRECMVTLAPSFTANNRSNKGAVGNCVTTMVHNHCPPADRAPPPKSSNQTAPCLNNIMKAATDEGAGGTGLRKPQKNTTVTARSSTGAPARRTEVTEEEAERFIHQVNQAAITIQRWYRHQVQRRAGAAGLEHLLRSKREEQRQRRAEGNILELGQQKAMARKKAREEKARQARRAAIQELQQRRAPKSAEVEAPPPQEPQAFPRPRREPALTMEATAPSVPKANNAGSSIHTTGPSSSPEPCPSVEKAPQDSHVQDRASEVLGTAGPTKPRVTLDELLDTLRLLEAEPEPLPQPPAYHKEKYAWIDEEEASSPLTADNLEKLGQLSAPLGGPPDDGTLLSEAKLNSILSFLDEMEPSARERPAVGPQWEGLMLGAELASLECASAGTTAVMRLRLEMEEKRQAVALLQQALAQQRALTARQVKEAEQELRRQLRQQKDHYEATIQRHLNFIDQVSGPREVGPGLLPLSPPPWGCPLYQHLLQEARDPERVLTCLCALPAPAPTHSPIPAQGPSIDWQGPSERHGRVLCGSGALWGRALISVQHPPRQLIQDKKALGEKCEAVVAELRQGDRRWKEKEAQMQAQHELELKKLRELTRASEKVRRERWVQEKTRKIKELTVKGLEPEIQRLIAQHKQEVKKLKSLHEAELLQAEARAAQRCEHQAEQLRARLQQEQEALGQRERELTQQRFEQHLEQEQRALEQQRRRLYNEVAEERERLGQQAARQRAELEALRQQLEESGVAAGRALRAECERTAEEQERRHQAELQALKDQLESERQTWEASSAKKEEAWLLSRERELKEELRKGRDKDIELVIRRLEADMTQAREEVERAADSRVLRLRDQLEAERLELVQSERRLQGRCSELQSRLGEAEGEAGRLQGLLRQKERALEDARAENEQLAAGPSGQAARQFAEQLAAAEGESQRLRAELGRLAREKQDELEEVHRRVKLALARKEEAVRTLREQHEAAVKRADHLEELLEEHRRPAPTAK
ncbi:centrosomal protein of 131 kDa isoform X2 [Tenrec ecaudatus]|uniref:centrosomal protein of 131 kDa isoform X2 n=1 Tax=Tenrec ecaudatus TaxID=94439 RepID=UPI003F5A0E62